MPTLTGSGVTADQLERHLRGTPLAGHGADFVNAGRRYRVDPRLLVSIASAESSLGRHANGYNAFGWGPGIHFASWGQAIDTVARGLRQNYLGRGLRTIEQIGAKYAPQHVANDPTGLNSNWVKNVKAMYRQLGGGGNLAATPAGAGAVRSDPGAPAPLNLRPVVEANLTDFGGGKSPVAQLNDLAQYVRSQPRAAAVPAPAGQPQTLTGQAVRLGKVILAPGADRAGVHTNPAVLNFARRVAALYGRPLTIGTGTNHNRLTVDGNVSDHWSGNAVDIPLSGAQLLRAGRLALMAAGMPRAKAMRAKGGLYNVGGHQIIFLTNQGGNHFNHLHISAH